MASGITLKVDPSTLKSQANAVSGELKSLEKQWRIISSTVLKTKGYWEGDASNQHQESFANMKNDIDIVLKRLKEHPTDLLQMAGIYEESEHNAQEIASALPKDVLV